MLNPALAHVLRFRPLWTPKQITTAAWWDFSDATTITIATGVSAITDKSGNGRTLSQATTTKQPTITTAAYNGLNAAVFNGGTDPNGDYLERTGGAFIYSLSSGSTAVCVAKSAASSNDRSLLFEGSSTDFLPFYNTVTTDGVSGNGKAFIRDNGGTIEVNASLGITPWDNTLRMVSVTDTTTTITGYLDGTVGSTPRNYTRAATTLDITTLGAFNNTGVSGNWLGDIGEMVIFAGTNTANRQLVEGYMAWKWGRQANLAAAHPYVSAAPRK